MSSSKIETLLDEVQAAFDRQPEDIETDWLSKMPLCSNYGRRAVY